MKRVNFVKGPDGKIVGAEIDGGSPEVRDAMLAERIGSQVGYVMSDALQRLEIAAEVRRLEQEQAPPSSMEEYKIRRRMKLDADWDAQFAALRERREQSFAEMEARQKADFAAARDRLNNHRFFWEQ